MKWNVLVEKMKVISSFNHLGPYPLYQTQVLPGWARVIREYVPNQRKYNLKIEYRKKGKFFRYKVSEVIKPKIENWDNLGKQVRREIKRAYLKSALERIQQPEMNKNENIEMNLVQNNDNQGSN